MKKSLLILIGTVALAACKKEHSCYCKHNANSNEDFTNIYKTTKKRAKASCENQHAFWSPEYSCSLK